MGRGGIDGEKRADSLLSSEMNKQVGRPQDGQTRSCWPLDRKTNILAWQVWRVSDRVEADRSFWLRNHFPKAEFLSRLE